MQNKIIYDYLSFTSKIHSVEDLKEMLGLSDLNFQLLHGFYGYQDRLYYDGIHIHYNGRKDADGVDFMGICVEMSGQGCRVFEEYGNGDYDFIFKEILENYNDNPEKRQMNITRLDVAYDDFEGLIDLNVLIKEAQLGNYVSRCDEWEVINGSKGRSVNHGSKQSSVYIRIYDKRMERKRKDIDHWVRCEFQLRKDSARGFIKLDGTIDKNYFDMLNNYLRYIVPTDDTNKRRESTAPYWLNWLESFDGKSIFDKPKTEYNLMRCENFVYHQAGNAIDCLISVKGIDTVVEELKVRKPKQTLKYMKLIDEFTKKYNNENG